MKNADRELYTKPSHNMIAYGDFKGVKWAILNNGMFPLVYIENILGFKDDDDYEKIIKVHGGITYNNLCYWNQEDKSDYIGWDYGHLFDYSYFHPDGKKHSYEEIKKEVFNTINALKEYKDNGN